MFTELGRIIRSEVVLHLFHAELAPEQARAAARSRSQTTNGNIHYEHETSAGAAAIAAARGGGAAVAAGVPSAAGVAPRPCSRASTTRSAATTRAGAARARSSRSATAPSAPLSRSPGERTLAQASVSLSGDSCMAVVRRSPESADQDGMGRRWAAWSLFVAGLAAVIVTAGLGQTENVAQTPSTPSQPVAGPCVGTGMERVCIPASTQSGGPEAYCISAVSDGHWAYIDRPVGHLIDDPAATTDPCERPNG